jgi:hypothetical protein
VRHAVRNHVRLIAAIAVLAMVALAAGLFIGFHVGAPVGPTPVARPPTPTPTASPPPGPGPLAADFAQLEDRLHAAAGIALSAVGAEQAPMTLGDWQSGPAWSTIKVPLVIAAYRQKSPPALSRAMDSAITESDNAAAEQVWAGLGDPITAANDVDAVLRQTGDPTVVQSHRVRPEYTAFGQTDWSLVNQVRFVSAALCDNANEAVFTLMGQIERDQSWGIGTVPGTRFKGGWGPSPTGSYLVRQMGILAAPGGYVAVALAAEPASGRFEDGIAALSEMATWLTDHLGALPSGRCAP